MLRTTKVQLSCINLILVFIIGFEHGADLPLSMFIILAVLFLAIFTAPIIEPRKESE